MSDELELIGSSWSSYPSIFTMGHRAIKDLLSGPVNVEEKVDGSQFSFGLVSASQADPVYQTIDGVDYALKVRSKGAVMHVDAPQAMFSSAVDTVRKLAEAHLLFPGWTYRGEVLAKPKHNALAYDRTPKGNVIIFDINTGNQEYLTYEEKVAECARLGLECVPRLYTGVISSVEDFRRFLGTVSILGGQNIEGVVVKPVNYDLFGTDKKVLLGKFVSEAFKEVHRKSWGESNPTSKDIITQIGDALRTPARWNKAIQHAREAGTLLDDVRDIGPLIRTIPPDILKEEEDWIKDRLFKWAWPHLSRSSTAGFAQWYKEQLLAKSFEPAPEQELTPEPNDHISSVLPVSNSSTNTNQRD